MVILQHVVVNDSRLYFISEVLFLCVRQLLPQKPATVGLSVRYTHEELGMCVRLRVPHLPVQVPRSAALSR